MEPLISVESNNPVVIDMFGTPIEVTDMQAALEQVTICAGIKEKIYMGQSADGRAILSDEYYNDLLRKLTVTAQNQCLPAASNN
ncbi:MAG TPA: hypothetical protein VEA37_10175 [Flavobacterium sp.]|nr:hypothetical protein [Flavobacterium sp.]